MQQVLVDASVIVALYDKNEWAHGLCAKAIEEIDPPLLTCEPVITEACHLLRHMPNAIGRLLESIELGDIKILFELGQSLPQVRTLLAKYADTPADFADACLIQMADELNTGRILTLDSDFRHYRWRKNKRFDMLVPLK